MLSTSRLAIRRKLLRWYERNKRDLPWRRTRDPYAIWIAETMLQQTQVKTVIPYYEKFLATFPTVSDLAGAPRQKVLRHWSGLGYYRRAENLRKAATQIVRRHGGELPREPDRLRALAGVGDYTAGALLSIAFDRPYPAIDGNVRRVLSRLCRLKTERQLRRTAATLVPKKNPGTFNQALMELGATLCAPKNPRCPTCPLRSQCATALLPPAATTARNKSRRRVIDIVWPLAIVRRGGKILLRRRDAKGLLAGLWELPGGELLERESTAAALARHLPSLGVSLAHAKKIGVVHHAITYRRIRAPVFLFGACTNCDIVLPGSRWRWVPFNKLAERATSSMTAKAASLVSAYEKTLL
ncbi:MAG: A/G-specific adenine glycosylase [Chloroflexota bacterium]